jgi:8-oxo-dGTP diphosphatase
MRWQDRWKVVPAVYVVLMQGDKILLLRRYQTGYQDGNYGLPAGHLDGGESALTAAVREAQEEVGVTIDPADLELVHTTHRLAEEGDHERIDMYFKAKNYLGEPNNMEPDKCDELRWVSLNNLPGNIIPSVKLALSSIDSGKAYSDIGF